MDCSLCDGCCDCCLCHCSCRSRSCSWFFQRPMRAWEACRNNSPRRGNWGRRKQRTSHRKSARSERFAWSYSSGCEADMSQRHRGLQYRHYCFRHIPVQEGVEVQSSPSPSLAKEANAPSWLFGSPYMLSVCCLGWFCSMHAGMSYLNCWYLVLF